MSERVERRLVELLDHPDVSPYGNPIPGLSELGERQARERFLDGVVTLVDAVGAEPLAVVVRRIGEPLQVDVELLARLVEAGVTPGSEVVGVRRGGLVAVGRAGADFVLDLPDDVARHVFVTAPS